MENNIYTWHNELMVNVEMNELSREIEGIRLLRDAGLANPGWIERLLDRYRRFHGQTRQEPA